MFLLDEVDRLGIPLKRLKADSAEEEWALVERLVVLADNGKPYEHLLEPESKWALRGGKGEKRPRRSA